MPRIIALVLLLCVAASAGANGKTPGAFLYSVRIDPEGRVLTIEPQADPRIEAPAPAVEAALRERLLAHRYARADTRGGTLTTWLEGRFVPAADGRPEISELRAGPRLVRADPPHAPPALIRDRVEADLVLRLKLGASGVPSIVAIDGIDALGRDHSQRLRERIEYAVRVWRFQPERWDGRAIESEFAVELQYRIDRREATDWTWRGSPVDQLGPVQVPVQDFRAPGIRLGASRR